MLTDIENIDFHSEHNCLLFNPKALNNDDLNFVEKLKACNLVTHHFIIQTSGTSGKAKWTALSKNAVLASAKAVNTYLKVTSNDIWFNVLPKFHVAGLGNSARAYCAEVPCIEYQEKRWDVEAFLEQLQKCRATLTSLVPTQVYDLVRYARQAPKNLRAVIVGGGVLNDELYLKAKKLNWPLLTSFGMTESASQIATACLSSIEKNEIPNLKPLNHLDLKLTEDGFLQMRGSSIFTGYVEETNGWIVLNDPKIDGWFKTEDKVEMANDEIKRIYRDRIFLKIGGLSVDKNKLDALFEKIKLEKKISFDAALVAKEDARLGAIIHMVSEEEELSFELMEQFNNLVAPYERIRQIDVVEKIPRTALGKLIL